MFGVSTPVWEQFTLFSHPSWPILRSTQPSLKLQASWNLMAHAQKPDFVFRRNGRVHLNHRGRQFIRLLAAEVCVSAVVMLDTPCSEVVWRVLATHSIRQFPLHFPSRTSPYAITFQLDSTEDKVTKAWRWTAPPYWVKVQSDRATAILPPLCWWQEL